MRARLKEPWELNVMRQSGGKLAEVVAILREAIAPGITTSDLDRMAEDAIRARGGIPSFKGYAPAGVVYPATICASPNDAVVHGIPNELALKDGDVISIDVGLIFGGYHSDCAFTVVVGEGTEEVRRLLDVTEQSMYEGIALAVPGNRIGDIGHAIQSFVEPHGFGIVREFVGHGIGRLLHEPPSVPNFGKARSGQLLKPGTCLAIEPMVTLGTHRTKTLDDGWTVVTADGSLAAHFEHTVAITPRGTEILTALDAKASA